MLIEPLKTSRLRIRNFDKKDRNPFVKFMTDQKSTKYLNFDAKQKSESGATRLLDATIASYHSANPMLAFAVEKIDSEEFIGFCGLSAQNKEDVEIMYAVIPEQQRKGYATEITVTLAEYALYELKYKRVLAPISPENIYSRRVAERSGFKDMGLIQHKNYADKVHDYVRDC